MQHVAPVIGVCRGPGGDAAPQVARDHRIGACPAHALLRTLAEGVDAAGTHGAVAAGQPELAVAALRFLGVQPVPDGLDALVAGTRDHPLCVLAERQLCGVGSMGPAHDSSSGWFRRGVVHTGDRVRDGRGRRGRSRS